MTENIIVRAVSAPWHDGVEILIKDGNSYGISVTFQKPDEGLLIEPTARISNTAAQTLMDDLWNAGLRPTEGSGSAGSLRETENHLSDMRRIVARKLGVEL